MWLIRVLAQALLYIVKQYAAPAPGLTSSTHEVNKPSLQRFAEEKQTAQMRCLYCCGSPHLLYADDIALIAASKEDLQNMLSLLENWCEKWRMKVNSTKSNIVHFGPCCVPKPSYLFVYNMDVIEIVSRYKCLGIVLDEMLDYSVTANVLAYSGGRVLGSLYTKFRNNKGFGYTTYTKMFDSCVSPILDYCSGVWGYNKLE